MTFRIRHRPRPVRAVPKVIEYSPVRGSPEQQGVPLRLSGDVMTIDFRAYACGECLKAVDKHSWRHAWELGQQVLHVLDDHIATSMDSEGAGCKFMSKWVPFLICKSFDEGTAMKVKNC